ncbi:MAG TPA: hypothetical protein VEX41_04850 [Candidatus Eisenbacteria bacterium]|nr:hypothetical protein [Candidatus Eisenbacteria bacterium]
MRLLLGLVRTLARSAVLLLVMSVVILVGLVARLPLPVTLALAIALPGLTGLFWVAQRRQGALVTAHRAADATGAAIRAVGPEIPTRRATVPDVETAFEDPEASMPRWRRPSLLLARKADPMRTADARRGPIRFPAGSIDRSELRMVRYAVVPLLDWPDEVLGERQDDLATGDEIRVLGARGSFLEIECPDGRRGWIHRTTVGPPAEPHPEAQEALDAILLARGLR